MSPTCKIFISLLFYSREIFSLILDLFLVSLDPLNMWTLNIRFFANLHYAAIADLAGTRNIDVFALTETWIYPNTTSAQLFDAIPRGFSFINTPRPVADPFTSSIIVAAQHFLCVNFANFSPHLMLLLNPLNCLHSQSNFVTLIGHASGNENI